MIYPCLIERLAGDCDTEAFTIYSPSGGYLLLSSYTRGAEEGIERVRAWWEAGLPVLWRSGVSQAQRDFLRRLQQPRTALLSAADMEYANRLPGARAVRKP